MGTPGLENFASLTSVVLEVETTTSTTTITSTTSALPTTTTTPTTLPSVSTTTTLPCTTPRCTIDAALGGDACGDEVVPTPIRKKLDRAIGLIDRAAGRVPKKAKRLLKQARHLLALAGKAAGKSAKGKRPKLTQDCAAAIQGAVAIVGASAQR